LLAGGVEKIGIKIVEEAAEVVEAAGEPGTKGREHFIREVGDLVYHLLVLMQHKKCSLPDLEAELARRFGVSGLQEKAARSRPKTPKATSPKAARPKATNKKVAKKK
jgi:phosphoribosyl-ATP pyrophosphohydrolase